MHNIAPYIPNVNGLIEGGSFATLHHPGHLGQRTRINVGTDLAPIWVTYELVKLKAGVTFAVGEIVYWDDYDDRVVTNVQAGNNAAGFIPAGGAATPAPTYPFTAGQYCYIVVEGLRAIKGLDSVTSAADANGKACIPSATAGRVDVLAAATAPAANVVARTRGTQDGTTKLMLAMVSVGGNN